jgi:hypothetical protein
VPAIFKQNLHLPEDGKFTEFLAVHFTRYNYFPINTLIGSGRNLFSSIKGTTHITHTGNPFNINIIFKDYQSPESDIQKY